MQYFFRSIFPPTGTIPAEVRQLSSFGCSPRPTPTVDGFGHCRPVKRLQDRSRRISCDRRYGRVRERCSSVNARSIGQNDILGQNDGKEIILSLHHFVVRPRDSRPLNGRQGGQRMIHDKLGKKGKTSISARNRYTYFWHGRRFGPECGNSIHMFSAPTGCRPDLPNLPRRRLSVREIGISNSRTPTTCPTSRIPEPVRISADDGLQTVAPNRRRVTTSSATPSTAWKSYCTTGRCRPARSKTLPRPAESVTARCDARLMRSALSQRKWFGMGSPFRSGNGGKSRQWPKFFSPVAVQLTRSLSWTMREVGTAPHCSTECVTELDRT